MYKALMMCAVCGFTHQAMAQTERAATLTLDPSASYAFEADLDGEGDYTVGRVGIGLRYSIPIEERSQLSFEISTERSEYDFSGATGLAPGGEPIEGATSYGFGARLYHPIDDEFAFIGGASVSFAGEDGADFGESAVLAGFGGAIWRVSEDLSLTLGVGVSDRLEDDARIIPLIGVEWKIDETLRLSSTEVGRVLSTRSGAGIGLVFESAEDLSFVTGVAFGAREFRLDENGSIPNGVLRDDRVVVGLGVIWEPNSAVTAQLGVGAAVWSNIETLSSTGAPIGDEDGDPAPFVTARVQILF